MDQNTVIVNESLPRHTDQATSPMNSFIHHTPMQSHRSYSRIYSDVRNNEDRPQSSQRKNVYSQHIQNTSNTNRSFFNETPISSNRNRSFITDIDRNCKSPLTVSEKRSATPLVSYRNTPIKGKDNDSSQLINYACTPPRPILSSEANSAVFCNLSTKRTEFFLITQMFIAENKRVKQVMKTYTYALQKTLQIPKPGVFLHKEGESENIILFHSASLQDLEIICQSSEGFSAVYRNNPKDVFLASNLASLRTKNDVKAIIIALVNSRSLLPVNQNLFQLVALQKISPVYFVEFY